MAKRDKTHRPTEGDLFQAQIFQEHLTAKEKKMMAGEAAKVVDLVETNRAYEIAERDGLDEEEIRRADGKILRGHGRKKSADDPRQLTHIFDLDTLKNGILLPEMLVQKAIKATTSILTKTFGPKADIVVPAKCKDDEGYEFDTMQLQLSDPVFDKLIEESNEITAMVEKLDTIKDPAQREAYELRIKDRAADFEMRLHPITMRYAHNYDRAMEAEKLYAKQCELKHIKPEEYKLGVKNHMICAFRLTSEIGDLRGVKVRPGDQYNNDPREAIASGPNAPAPS